MSKKLEKVLVIGGGGFLGSHTADALSKKGYQVSIFDKKPSRWLRSDQEMVLGDYSEEKDLKKALKGVSFVYHFGAIADIAESKRDPFNTLYLNIIGTVKILEAIKSMKVKRFLFASSMYVYSDLGSFYSVSKSSAESIIEAYGKEFGIDFTLMRYGSLYGSRSQDWNAIRNFVKQILKNKKLTYSGTGKEIREYINVEDAAQLSVKLLDKKYANNAYTITGQQTIKVDDLFSILFEIIGTKRKVDFLDDNSRSEHYGLTPYRHKAKDAKKIVPTEFKDLGQGLLEIVEEVQVELDKSES